MIYKYSFSITGDNFYPERVIKNIKVFEIGSFFSPTDKRVGVKIEEYGYGNLSFWHPKKFATEDEILIYEKDFIEFIEKNYHLFIDNGANELEIFIEIYFDGGQCNFEIFDKEILKKISKFGISMPISIYVLSDEEIQKWEHEIKLHWKM